MAPRVPQDIDPSFPLLEHLRGVACVLRQNGWIRSAVLLEGCVAEMQGGSLRVALFPLLRAAVAAGDRWLDPVEDRPSRRREVFLPGVPFSGPVPPGWEEDPQPVTRSDQDLVVSQGRAIKILCNLYGWRRTDWGTLVKTRPGGPVLSLVPDPPSAPAGPVDLVEVPGSIADHAAAAAASIA